MHQLVAILTICLPGNKEQSVIILHRSFDKFRLHFFRPIWTIRKYAKTITINILLSVFEFTDDGYYSDSLFPSHQQQRKRCREHK
ncbi:MAG: hypothetical protein WC765_07175 [Phycisphaerae bacterium]